MCGAPGDANARCPSNREIDYLDGLVRGVYAKRDLPAGHSSRDDDVYLAIPLQKGQISCRELMRGRGPHGGDRARRAGPHRRHRQPVRARSGPPPADRRARVDPENPVIAAEEPATSGLRVVDAPAGSKGA